MREEKVIIWPTIKKKKLIRATLLASKLQIHERNIENEWYIYDLQSSQVKRTPQDAINEFIIRKLNTLVVVDFRFISAFSHA